MEFLIIASPWYFLHFLHSVHPFNLCQALAFLYLVHLPQPFKDQDLCLPSQNLDLAFVSNEFQHANEMKVLCCALYFVMIACKLLITRLPFYSVCMSTIRFEMYENACNISWLNC